MKILAIKQLVGTAPGFGVFRNLFELENGEIVSIRVSREIDMSRERKLGERYPSQKEMFDRHKLPIYKFL